MGNTQLSLHQRCSFVDSTQQDVAEEDGPDAVIDLFEADAVLAERGREVQQAGLE